MKKRLITLPLIVIVLIFALVCIDFIGFGGKTVTVSIPQGAGAKHIISLLEDKRVIRFPFLFLEYMKEDTAHLKAGVHTFKTNMGYKNTLAELLSDAPLENTVTITIPEGYEAREIAILLEENNIITRDEFYNACKSAHKSFDFLPQDGNVEGYLFPATYTFLTGTKAENVVHTMINTFKERMYTEENISRAKSLNLSFHEALTLASIVEREAAKDDERETVSSVFHNRLKMGMKLESCATVQYILKERKKVLSIEDTKINSPYNTYRCEGLPPSPISSPGEKSFYAALNPKDTKYLFFVADGTGGHTFSETYEEHLNAMQ